MTRFKGRIRASAAAAAVALSLGAASASAAPSAEPVAQAAVVRAAAPAAGSGALCRLYREYCGIVFNKGSVAFGVGTTTGGAYKLLHPGRSSDALFRDTNWAYSGPGYRMFVPWLGRYSCYNGPVIIYLGDARYSIYAQKGKC